MCKLDYFKTTDFLKDFPKDFLLFNGNPIPGSVSPEYNVLQVFGMCPKDFANKANNLFEKYNIKVPDGYPKKRFIKREIWGKDKDITSVPWTEFCICIGCSILIEEKFSIDISRIIRDELIYQNSREGILHAASLTAIVLHYLKLGFDVNLQKEEKKKYTSDLVINGIDCELKVVDESDLTQEKDMDHLSGKGKIRSISEDICYDIGTFLGKKDSGHKGIKQSDVIFADLSFKSLKWLAECDLKYNNKSGLPALQKHRVIFFVREIIDFQGFYIDFDPLLWNLIKNTKKKYRLFFPPFPKI